jgi:queuine tRNA-ribosyltransferase
MAVVPDPERRWRIDLGKARWRHAKEPLMDGCPCPACRAGYSRGYLHYLVKAREPTAARLLTLHNLAFLQRLMTDLRGAVLDGTLTERAAALRAGAAPGST